MGINTIIGFFIFMFMIAQSVKLVKYFIKIVQHPEVKQSFPLLAFIVSLAFVISIIYFFIMSIVDPTSSPAPAPTVSPTRRVIPTMTSVPTRPASAGNECTLWNKVTASMEARKLQCVYGNVVDYVENPTLNATYFYFGTREQFFLVASDLFFPNFEDGDCAQVSGIVQINTYGTPYIKIDELHTCD